MRIVGKIVKTRLEDRIIGVKAYHKILYLYFQNSQLNLFRRYLELGTYIDLDYDEEKSFIRHKVSAFVVNYVQSIFSFYFYKRVKYFDRFEINNSLSTFLNDLGNIMFLDLEMTMPSYPHKTAYISEMIQAGYVLINGLGNEICRYNHYIEPILHMELSKRTLKFLNLNVQDFHRTSISYQEFYDEFSMIIDTYHPAIVIFGKNDKLVLNESFAIHRVPSLVPQLRYVNLSKLIQNYYLLKNEPGLFKLFQIYYNLEEVQTHDAFNDAYVTMMVFKAFRDDVSHKTNFYDMIKDKCEPK